MPLLLQKILGPTVNSTGSITSNVFCIGMITGRVVSCSGSSRWRSFPLCGPLPFSGANAALGYLPLQLALRPEIRILMIRKGKGPFLQQVVFHDLCKQKSRIFHSKHDTKVVPKLQKTAKFGTTALFHIFSK